SMVDPDAETNPGGNVKLNLDQLQMSKKPNIPGQQQPKMNARTAAKNIAVDNVIESIETGIRVLQSFAAKADTEERKNELKAREVAAKEDLAKTLKALTQEK